MPRVFKNAVMNVIVKRFARGHADLLEQVRKLNGK